MGRHRGRTGGLRRLELPFSGRDDAGRWDKARGKTVLDVVARLNLKSTFCATNAPVSGSGTVGSDVDIDARPQRSSAVSSDREAGESLAALTSQLASRRRASPRTAPDATGLTGNDKDNLRSLLDHQIAQNTSATYRIQWRQYRQWAMTKGIVAMPGAPAHVAAYLAERLQVLGHKPATLRVAASAIAFTHKAAGVDDPCASEAVRRILKSATRKAGKAQKQAEALTADVLAAIQGTARHPRPRRGGGVESAETACRRATMDIAMISLMRDAMLRVSEAAALTWQDVASDADGTGRLTIRRSKTDVEGEGTVAFISAATMVTLAALRQQRDETRETEMVFGLRPNQIAKRIKLAAQAAGYGVGFSGHSPRVGMARDLARAGIELPSLMTAGRWRTSTMPALYIRNEAAGRGAVAQLYGYRSQPKLIA